MSVYAVDTTVPYMRHANGGVEFWYFKDGVQLSRILTNVPLAATTAEIEAAVQAQLTAIEAGA